MELNGPVSIIENSNKYILNPEVDMGSSKWLNLYRYNEEEDNTLSAINTLKEQGYKIVATTPHMKSYTPSNLPLDSKVALLYGTELKGLTDLAIEHADEYIRIPQFGFTESYNISVSVALIVHNLSRRLHESNIHWNLSEDEKQLIRLNWARRTLKRSEVIESEFLKKLIYQQ